MPAMPEVVPAEKWQQERDELLRAEKEATRALDALAARRARGLLLGPEQLVSLLLPFFGGNYFRHCWHIVLLC